MTKIALLIGVSEYGSGFKSLPGAQKDVQAMQQILQHPQICGFDEVKTLLNPNPQVMAEAIETVFSSCQSDDFVLLYFSGYGIKDDSGKLYLGTSITRLNTDEKLVKSSAVLASFVQEIISDSRSRHQLVILECCFSTTVTTSWSDKDTTAQEILQQLGGKQRVILTSSTSTQCCREHNTSDVSAYTRYLVEGMQTGAADLDNDGVIVVEELHAYTSSKVQIAIPLIQPGIYGQEDARLLVVASAPLDEPKRRYRGEVSRCAQDGEISIVSRSILDVLREPLGLLPEEAVAIEAEVLEPYREYKKKLQRYVQECVAAIHDSVSISNDTRSHFQHLQLLLGLKDEDVAPLEAEVQRQITALQSPDTLEVSSQVTLASTQQLTPVKLLNTSSSAHPHIVPVGRNSRLPLGIGIAAAVLTLTGGGIYGVRQWQDSQLLKTINALTQERNYEECITVGQTISESSSRYTDAQILLKQCEAGVNWQNAQVQNLGGHSDMVWSVAFSSDGQPLLASGSSDNTVKIWNLGSTKPLRTLKGHSDTVWTIAFSPDGQFLASGSSDNTIKIWKLSSGEVLRTLSKHINAVRTIAFSPDGRTLASGSSDNTIKIWNLGSGKLLRTLRGHSNTVRSIAFTPDGQSLISGSSDNTIKIWKLSSGELLRTLKGHSKRVVSVALSPDGQLLASGSVDKTIKIWNLSSGKLLRTLFGNSDSVNSVAISPDGRILASGIGDITKIWDLNTGELLHTLSKHSNQITSISFSPNGKTLASASQDKTIKIWWR